MVIAQLSNLHVGGGRYREELLRTAIAEINASAPNVVAELSARRSDPFVRAQRGLSLAEDSGTPPG